MAMCKMVVMGIEGVFNMQMVAMQRCVLPRKARAGLENMSERLEPITEQICVL